MLGKIAEVLGRPGDKGIDMLSIIRRLDLPDKFPDGAQRQAEGLKAPTRTRSPTGGICAARSP